MLSNCVEIFALSFTTTACTLKTCALAFCALSSIVIVAVLVSALTIFVAKLSAPLSLNVHCIVSPLCNSLFSVAVAVNLFPFFAASAFTLSPPNVIAVTFVVVVSIVPSACTFIVVEAGVVFPTLAVIVISFAPLLSVFNTFAVAFVLSVLSGVIVTYSEGFDSHTTLSVPNVLPASRFANNSMVSFAL